MNSRYCSASANTEIRCRSTFWRRASSSNRSSGPSKPSRSTQKAGSLSARSIISLSNGCPSAMLSARITHLHYEPSERRKVVFSDRNRKGRVKARPRVPRIEIGRARAQAGKGSLGALQRAAGEGWRDACDLLHALRLAVAMEDHIDPGAQRGLGTLAQSAGECLHRKIVAEQESIEPDPFADDLLDNNRRDRCRPLCIERGIDDMRAHADRQIGIGDEWREVRGLKIV